MQLIFQDRLLFLLHLGCLKLTTTFLLLLFIYLHKLHKWNECVFPLSWLGRLFNRVISQSQSKLQKRGKRLHTRHIILFLFKRNQYTFVIIFSQISLCCFSYLLFRVKMQIKCAFAVRFFFLAFPLLDTLPPTSMMWGPKCGRLRF